MLAGAFDGAFGSMSMDDVSFSGIPAPGAAMIFGLGGVAFAQRRRR